MGTLARWVMAACVLSAAPAVVGDRAGAGAGTISGYRVQELRWVPSAGAPDLVEAVTFRLDAAASFARVSVTDGGTWFECEGSKSMLWECALPGVPLAEIVQTRVVAAQI